MEKFGSRRVLPPYVVAMVMSIITVTAPWLQGGIPLAVAQQITLSVDAREFLQAHNQLRTTARVPNLVWNGSLAAVATSFVEQQCASLVPCSSAQGVPAYSSGQNSWCIVATDPEPTSDTQSVATSSQWVTRSFPTYVHRHHLGHCNGEEGAALGSSGSARAPVVSCSAPASVGSGSQGSVSTEPLTPVVRSGIAMPPSPDDDGYGDTAPPTLGSGFGGGPDAAPTSTNIFPGIGNRNDSEEGDGGDSVQYFAQIVDDKTLSMGCYSLQCAVNGVSYAACEYFPAFTGFPNAPPTPSTK